MEIPHTQKGFSASIIWGRSPHPPEEVLLLGSIAVIGGNVFSFKSCGAQRSYGDLNENGPHRPIYLSVCFLVGRIL